MYNLLVNREANETTGTDKLLSELWENGHVYFASLYDAGGYVKLAEYITKLWKNMNRMKSNVTAVLGI